MAASKSETAVFAGADGSFKAAENNLLFDKICACTSRPTTLLYLPLDLNETKTWVLIWIKKNSQIHQLTFEVLLMNISVLVHSATVNVSHFLSTVWNAF